MKNFNSKSLVTVGIPVYNGGKYIEKRIESIIKQTYQNFEIIISDNASTDNTSKICEKFLIDEKIHYYKQKTNIGIFKNFNYLITNAKGKYFVIASVDDKWEPTFLEKNVEVLESNENIVGSISKVEFYGHQIKKQNSKIFSIKKIIRRSEFDPLIDHVVEAKGNYEEKAEKYLRFNQGSFIHGLFRTNAVKKIKLDQSVLGWDLCFILGILKFGDLHVIDETLLYKFSSGLSSKGLLALAKSTNSFFDLFTCFPFFNWCRKNIGMKFCIKNLDWFIFGSIFRWIIVAREYFLKNQN